MTQTASAGHTCLPEEKLLTETARLLQIAYAEVYEIYNKLIKDDLLRTEEFAGTRLVYPEYLYRAEIGVARRLLYLRDKVNRIWQVDYQSVIENWEHETGLKLAEAQIEAISASVEHGIFILTGGPGTGKTTVVKGILAVLEKAGCKILLAAPTGRAARRLAESAGHPASTVHRMLEYTPNGEAYFFGRNEENPLEADAIIVDEASMLDITLAHNLLKAVSVGCRLILVGDVDQLPSVGPGTVLKDIIRSKMMPVVRLNSIFRQAALSPIVLNAHRINKGLQPECDKCDDFCFMEINDETEAAEYIVDNYARITASEGWEGVQVLSPMHKNPCGVMNLNKLLQERMNPAEPGKTEIMTPNGLLRTGDKVMQIRNNYEKDVFNGDIGRIDRISGTTVSVLFPERPDGEKVDLTTNTAIVTNSTAVMLTTVAGDANAIGYASLGSLDDTNKILQIDGVDATVENIKDGSYKISRPFNIVTQDGLSDAAQDFVNFILSSDGQAVVENSGYIPLDNAPAYTAQADKGKIVVSGSSSVTPVMEKLKEDVQKRTH